MLITQHDCLHVSMLHDCCRVAFALCMLIHNTCEVYSNTMPRRQNTLSKCYFWAGLKLLILYRRQHFLHYHELFGYLFLAHGPISTPREALLLLKINSLFLVLTMCPWPTSCFCKEETEKTQQVQVRLRPMSVKGDSQPGKRYTNSPELCSLP